MSASASFPPQVPLPDVGDPVGVRELERTVRQRVDELAQPLGEAAHDGIRERDGALQTRSTDELDALVHGGVGGDGVEIGELVGADPERGQHRRIELAHGTAAERLDPVVERADALHRPVGDALGERAVTLVERLRGGGERSIGVRVLLEHAPHDLVRRAPRGRDAAHGLRPRR